MNKQLLSASDFVLQKQSVAQSGDKALEETFDLSLANFLQAQLTEGDLVFCPVSGKVLPRNESITGVYVYWASKGGTAGVACVDNGEHRIWLFYEQAQIVRRSKAASKRKFDQWVASGGLHNSSQWWGPTDSHEIPNEFTVARMAGDRLEIFSHLYSRWISLRQLARRGSFKPRDLRRGTIFEYLSDISSSQFELPRMKREKRLLDHFGLPEPFDFWKFGDADGHRSRVRSQEYFQGYNFV